MKIEKIDKFRRSRIKELLNDCTFAGPPGAKQEEALVFQWLE